MVEGLPESLAQEFPYRSRWLNLPFLPPGENKLHYIDEGEGEVVLCVHGNPTWSFYYRAVIASLRTTHRVISYDHLGCGLSSRPEQGFSYTLAEHIRVCRHLVEALGLTRINLLVHDWGGPIGLGFACERPELFRRIMISNTAAFMERRVPWRIAFLRTPWLGEWLMRRANLFARAAVYMATARGLSARQREGLLWPYRNYRQRIGIARFVADIPSKPSHPSYARLKAIEAALPQLTGKKLLLWGMKDFCFHPGFLAHWQEIYPEAEVARFAAAGHYLLEDADLAVCARIREFLQEDVQ